MQSFTEENYLKAIYHLSVDDSTISTNKIAAAMNTKPASVTDMLKKLSEKLLINYIPYQGVSLSDKGRKIAIGIVRKHRLWEHFLVEKLNFKWDEVHELAEELEHIQSKELIDRLDEFLNFPQHDPHGDPIPDRSGKIKTTEFQSLAALKVQDSGVISGVREHMPIFLQYLEKIKLTIGTRATVLEIIDYDHSVVLERDNGSLISISRDVAKNILIAL
ncbi:MAG: metal-dependent transcriptional regulator [Sphingobacteriaceae bacterium]